MTPEFVCRYVQVYALPLSEAGESLPNVYNGLIHCCNRRPTDSVAASSATFPKQFSKWKDGCFIYEPISANLRPYLTDDRFISSSNLVYFKVN